MNTYLTKLASKQYLMDISLESPEECRYIRTFAREMLRVGAANYIVIVDDENIEIVFKDVALAMHATFYSDHKLRLFERNIKEGSAAHRRYLKMDLNLPSSR
jgi:hypothetical protein